MMQNLNHMKNLGVKFHLRKKKLLQVNEYEICVLCGKQTDVHRDTQIDLRNYYVAGCGQLCRDCYNSSYHT